MAGPRALCKPKIVKKKTNSFKRFQSQRFKRVSTSWRQVHGIDSSLRRGMRGEIPKPNIGYRSNKNTRHMLPNGFFLHQVANVKDLEVLLNHNRTYAAQIAATVSAQKRKAIVARAKELNIRVLNADAKLRTEEQQ
ncbi:Ribosomal protein L32e [Carpediemonas membranifera]|uniref:Ribosomal protein L32e n=1 Tax=Carpediemonas membranifera TaxID=201153 RepID=A0A8J6B3C6_9EUKA|nr:Ribosomal protein L32e [Carpediemonas membranifera]|eukprot:TRINITY_DN14319_c0_g1_i1.p2 TRINITY_DN14319_c0_g1~~TRINITY_DN14319_c0_g1_i1.p2  ORF type:complete len:136 (+),score=11.69 TRINITY_DN14319_c0_g1_i1:13-420(+)